ncbi:MAG: hypothetical protein HYV42_03755 [Candidatus Magasanikbacteria bacterium]|nr:hypothetical protein [Candidatus Magasanikbacteria bacterium]
MGSYRPLDLQFNGYRSWEAYDLLNALGPAGRAAHQDTWWLDLVFPLCYAPFTAMLLARLWNARFAPGMMLCLLPFGGALLDYLENICIGVALFTYPARHDALMDFSGLVTALKWWGFAFPSLALVGIGGGWSLGAFLERRRRGAG